MNAPNDSSASFALRCMEIRGGSHAVSEAFTTPGLDAWLFSQPFEGADRGGDVYYVSLCGGGMITRLVVADVSGHGAEVAGFSTILRDLMRKNINTKSQTRLVVSLNRQFGESAQLLRFATAVVATYLANHRTLTLCNAGHPRPLWYRAATREWCLLDRDLLREGNLPLGLDDDSPYNQFTVTLDPGDQVLVYTDALIEADDDAGHMLGEEGLLALARELNPSDSATLGASLLATIERHRGGSPASDDVTLLVLHHNATGPDGGNLGERFMVYGKLFGLIRV